MKSFYKISPVLFLFILLLTACNKQNIDEIITEEPDYTPEITEVNNLLKKIDSSSDEGAELDCITIRFPFELRLESGINAKITTDSELQSALGENAVDSAVDFVFPMVIILPGGGVAEVGDNPTLGAYFASCIPDQGWDTALRLGTSMPAFLMDAVCYELIYPVMLEDDQSNTFVANDETELIDLLAGNDQLFYVFPMSVLDGEGNEVLLENVDAYFTLIYDCESIYPPIVGDGIEIQGLACYHLLFPFDVILENGDTVMVNDENEYAGLILNGQNMELQFPFSMISIINPDDEIIVIHNIYDFIAALLDCGIIIEITETELCDTPAHVLLFWNTGCGYQINFPAQVTAGGNTYVLNEFIDYFTDVYNGYNLNEIELVYPISVTLTQGGDVFSFDNAEEVCAFIENQCGE